MYQLPKAIIYLEVNLQHFFHSHTWIQREAFIILSADLSHAVLGLHVGQERIVLKR